MNVIIFRILNLCGNELSELPEDLSGFISLETLNLSCNKFESNLKAARLWSALASIPKLKDLDVSRNLLRGIHTEKLIPGNFNKLERLDFSYNRAENQHNLICTRNFKSLKMLIITGNPFGFFNQHKGLEKEIYMRVGIIFVSFFSQI
jgi:Leucine-rich repeat (LRR) protein